VLPADGSIPVSAVGPTFWWGGTVTDPNPHSLFGQGFLELQFYPDAIVNTCSSNGGFNVTYAPDKFSADPAGQHAERGRGRCIQRRAVPGLDKVAARDERRGHCPDPLLRRLAHAGLEHQRSPT